MIVVTGGTGFLGYHLVPQLLEAGYRVRLLVRKYAARPDVEEIEIDFKNEVALAKACEGAAAVIHAAGLVSYDRKDQHLMYETHVELTRRMINAARQVRVPRFIHVSSIVTLGHSKELRDETSPYNADGLRLAYWTTKTEAEKLALAANSPAMTVVSVNPGSLLGRGEKNGQLAPFIKKLAKARAPFLPDGGSDFLDTADAARGTILALTKGRGGERYTLGSENLTYLQLHERLRKIQGKTSSARLIPRALLTFLTRVLEAIEKLTGLDLPINSARLRRVNGVYMFHRLDKACAELGYEPRPIDEALSHMLEE